LVARSQTFRYNLSVPSSNVNKMGPIDCPKTNN